MNELNNWAIVEIKEPSPFGDFIITSFKLIHIYKFNSVWTIIFNFDLEQKKLVSHKIAENYILDNKNLLKYIKRLDNYYYLLKKFNTDIQGFVNNYIVHCDASVRVINTFNFLLSEKKKEIIYYYLLNTNE